MTQAIADPQEMQRFVSRLKQFNSKLASDASSLNGQFRQLGQTWRDQEYQKFAREFEDTLKAFRRFQEQSEKYIATITKKAQHLENYRNAR